MKRKLLITFGVSTLLFFTACGSDSKSKSTGPSTNDFKARDYHETIWLWDIIQLSRSVMPIL